MSPPVIRPVPGTKYMAGSDGNLWTLRQGALHPLKGYVRRDGYVVVGSRRKYYAHRLILLAFAGPCPPGCQARHLDGNPANNAPSNLRWDLPITNAADRRRHGTQVAGIRHPRAKLSDEQVFAVRELVAVNVPRAVIADRYGISKWLVAAISTGRRRKRHEPEATEVSLSP